MSLRDLADHAPPTLDDDGRVAVPLVLVDLDGPADAGLIGTAREAAARAEPILVGVRTEGALDDSWHELLTALDVTLAPSGPGETCVAAPAHRLAAAAAANPQAALVLAQVLRASSGLPVREALDVESLAYSTLLEGWEFGRWLSGRSVRPVPPSPADPVLVERAGDHLSITLNRPERRNAYGRELRDMLVDALRVAALDDTIRTVVLAGTGPSFCAGGDLDEFGTTPDPATAHFIRTRAGAAALLHRIAGRTEVRLHGACVGAGIELAAFAARVVADPSATIRLPELGMGLIPGAGGTVSIARRIGRWRTLYLALTGVTLDTATALAWGLVDECRSVSAALTRPPG